MVDNDALVRDVSVVCICCICCVFFFYLCFFFQAEDGIRDLVRSRGLGDVYKRQALRQCSLRHKGEEEQRREYERCEVLHFSLTVRYACYLPTGTTCPSCLLYTSDAADERSSVDLGGRRIIKKKTVHLVEDDTVTIK